MKLRSQILKIAIFATGLSGIVAEYILSTLATYFLGDSIFQWTMIVSVMLFAMGLGSRLSKYFSTSLLIKFIVIEFILSIFVSFSPLLTYVVSAYTVYLGLIIYSLSILIGILIGMEIPLVIRLNDELEELRFNVSSIIENDYYGSLIGGLFFAFVGLPYLGITYTPFILGAINLSVASILLIMVASSLSKKNKYYLSFGSATIFVMMTAGLYFAEPIILYGEQLKYKDKIVYAEQSKYQKIVLTQWKDDYWLYINGNQQLSTLDEIMYHEPIVHPVMSLSETPHDILVLGGGDGCAAREILKYDEVKTITLVDIDPAITEMAKTNSVLLKMNEGSLLNKKVNIVNEDAFTFVDDLKQFYDVIIIDLPDPRSVEIGRMYTYEYYKKLGRLLRPNGFIITQAGSPYYATKAFKCIELSMNKAGYNTVPIHNQILTMGEWGWIIGSKSVEKNKILNKLQSITFEGIELKWLNNEAMKLITSFGKNIYNFEVDSIEVNTIHNPVLYRYYLDGNWDIY